MEDEAQRNQGMGRGPESDAERAARREGEPGTRGRGAMAEDEVAAINARRAVAGKQPLGEDEEPDEEDLEVEGGEAAPAEGAAPA